jgi:hypothetical protein
MLSTIMSRLGFTGFLRISVIRDLFKWSAIPIFTRNLFIAFALVLLRRIG